MSGGSAEPNAYLAQDEAEAEAGAKLTARVTAKVMALGNQISNERTPVVSSRSDAHVREK